MSSSPESPAHSAPIDEPQRRRFITELDGNFSVVAAAGSGKTRAITERIIEIATSPHALEWLPQLVVVTFTNRAADEMQQRARQKILEAGVSLAGLGAFNRAFFGTIHSFCVKLLRQHGHHLGLPGKFELLTEDDELWNEFVQRQTQLQAQLTAEQRRTLLRCVPVRKLMELGRQGGAVAALQSVAPGPLLEPKLDFQSVYDFVAKGSSKPTVAKTQARLRLWETQWRDGEDFLALPASASTAKEFIEVWNHALEPLREWIRQCSLQVAAAIETDYRDFRLQKGVLSYHDQVSLASELLRHDAAAKRIREKAYRVILDEAQDTDPVQFTTLLELTRPPQAEGIWLDTLSHPPRPGHFCMVGDFQQSIFGERADLAHYKRVHQALLQTDSGDALEFSVTFRLDQKPLEFINATFPEILHAKDGQVRYVHLNTRPRILPGQIIRFELDAVSDGEDLKDRQRAQIEAGQLAAWIRHQGLRNLRARTWRDVAILCPRKDWFRPLRDALRREGLHVQIQSERDLKGDSPAYAWFTALLVCFAEPTNSYEIVGVLREIFGLSDHDLALYSEAQGARFQIARPTTAQTCPVADTLNLLASTRLRTGDWPLVSALAEILRVTQLRERLLTLPPAEFEGLAEELDSLLTQAADAEADQSTLADFAQSLRTNFSAVREVRNSTEDAIQLITCQKAKGSEWEAVIVPFLSRRIRPGSRKYPRLVRHPHTAKMVVLLDKDFLEAETKAAIDNQHAQEMERLLYVALTRAKHTLVLAHDRALFSGKKGVSKSSQTASLRCDHDGDNCPVFDRLDAALAACPVTDTHQTSEASRQAAEQFVLPLPTWNPVHASTGPQNATHFIKRNPSALAEDPRESVGTAATISTPAVSTGALYGIWWHGFVESLAWKADANSWDDTFAKALATTPDPERSSVEWTQLRAHLLAGDGIGQDSIAQWLTRPEVTVHVEMPFLWAMTSNQCIEGIIDLGAFDPVSGTWLVLDWKTNRVDEASGTDHLQSRYEPQMAAYWKALSAMLGVPVRAALYSTITGRWLQYDPAKLAATWTRLSLQPTALTEALQADTDIP